jgi:hypothetical protein
MDLLAGTTRQRRLEREGVLAGAEAGPHIIAIDRKTSRGSKRNKTDREAVKGTHTVSAWSTDRGLCLSEVVVEEKTNEISAVRDLLEITEVQGSVVAWDALNISGIFFEVRILRRKDFVRSQAA